MAKLTLIWRSADRTLATSVEDVVEVLPPLEWSPSPGAPEWVRGFFSYRGRRIPLLDAGALFETPRGADSMANRVLVLRSDRPALFGLWVRGVLDLERLDVPAHSSAPGAKIESRFGPVQPAHPRELLTPDHAAVLALYSREAAA